MHDPCTHDVARSTAYRQSQSLRPLHSSRPTLAPMPDSSSANERPSKGVIVRDLLLFQMKLWLDGLKDVVLSPVSIVAAVLDVLRSPERQSFFYRVLQLGERFDQWLNLYNASTRAPRRSSGLVGDDGDEMTRPLEVWGRRREDRSDAS